MGLIQFIKAMLIVIFVTWMIVSIFCLRINKSNLHRMILRQVIQEMEILRLRRMMEANFEKNPFLFENEDLGESKFSYDETLRDIKINHYKTYPNTFEYYNKLMSDIKQNRPASANALKQDIPVQLQIQYDEATYNLQNELYIFIHKQQDDARHLTHTAKCCFF